MRSHHEKTRFSTIFIIVFINQGALSMSAAPTAGSIMEIGHINLNVPSQDAALTYYVAALGLTRDPEAMTGTGNMWINVGASQFHLPSRQPTQRHRGTVGLVMPCEASGRHRLLQRLQRAQDALRATLFSFDESDECVNVQCPWGNHMRLHPPSQQLLGASTLGMAYIEFNVPPGTAQLIGSFYATVIGAAVAHGDNQPIFAGVSGSSVRVLCGQYQALIFRETALPLPEFDGYHIQITLSDFPAIYRRLADMRLITRGSVRDEEYRFTDIVNIEDGRVLFQVEHECRSAQHPLHGRHLVNCGAALQL
jgi:catechol-2,3-dioxygenase